MSGIEKLSNVVVTDENARYAAGDDNNSHRRFFSRGYDRTEQLGRASTGQGTEWGIGIGNHT
jgi:hypothetical protein